MPRHAVGKFSWTDLIMPAAIIGVGYYIFTQLDPGDTGTTSNNNVVDANTTAAASAAVKALQDAGMKQTVSDTTLSGLANSIYQYLVQDPPDQSSAMYAIVSVNNQLDWQKLVQFFGTRKANTGGSYSACALTGYLCDSVDLLTFIKMSMDAEHRSNINSFFSEQSINAQV
jgi:hypothetical protein